MILSDRTIREELAAGRIVIDPLDGRDPAVVGRSALSTRCSASFATTRRRTSTRSSRRRTSPSSSRSRRAARSSSIPASSCSARPWNASRSPTTSWRDWRGSRAFGRLGLLIHSTAGFVDAGWDGHLTLELSNVATLPIALYPGMKIGQISFLRMTTPADNPYGSDATGSKYQGQRGPTPSRYYLNFRRRRRLTRRASGRALRVGGHRPAHGRVPRRRVGRPRRTTTTRCSSC